MVPFNGGALCTMHCTLCTVGWKMIPFNSGALRSLKLQHHREESRINVPVNVNLILFDLILFNLNLPVNVNLI